MQNMAVLPIARPRRPIVAARRRLDRSASLAPAKIPMKPHVFVARIKMATAVELRPLVLRR